MFEFIVAFVAIAFPLMAINYWMPILCGLLVLAGLIFVFIALPLLFIVLFFIVFV